MDNWNDDRLDELARGMRHGFDKVDARFEKVEGEMKEGFDKVDARFEKSEGKMEAGFEKLQAANERLYRMLLGSAVAILAALIGVPALGV